MAEKHNGATAAARQAARVAAGACSTNRGNFSNANASARTEARRRPAA